MKSRTVKANRGKSSKAYDSKGRLARQVVDGSPIEYEYTKYGQLAGKYLGGKLNPDASVTYEYSKSGQIVARTANGVRQTYEYDRKGQLLAVKDSDGNALERYAYDKAGNMLKKTLRIGRGDSPSRPQYQTTTFTFDDANQLVSSTTDGVTTRYAYDAAGRLVKEGSKTYRYGYLDKVMSVTDNGSTYTYDYHADGQLASANYGDSSESFAWDGLALIQRGDEQFVNEPHVGGGNPVASSKGTSYFNDMLGTTVGSKTNGKYSAAALTAFGEDLTVHSPTPTKNSNFFTGKPYVEGLGHAFWMRNYRAGLAKWQTADPMGYPDGWNQLAYCGNKAIGVVDLLGCIEKSFESITNHNNEIDRIVGEYVREGWHVDKTEEPLTTLKFEVYIDYDAAPSARRWIDGHLYEIYRHSEGVNVYREYGVWATMSRSELLTFLLRGAAVGLAVSSFIFTSGASAVVLAGLSTTLLTYDLVESYLFAKASVYLGEYYILESAQTTITYKRRLIE